MGTINAYRDSSDPKVVHIVPSGFQPGETSPVNVKFNLTGYDEKIVQFTAQDTIAPPVQQAVEVSKTSITGYTDGSYIVNVTTQGTFTAVSDNSNIRVVSDQAQRTITVTVSPSSSQFSPQTGNITVSIPGYTDTVISVTLEAIDDIRVDAVPSGSKQYVNEPIVLTVSGTSKEVTAYSSDPLAVLTKNSAYEWSLLASGVCSATIGFTGDGVKSRTKNFDFAEQETPVISLTPSTGPYLVGDTVTVTISGLTSNAGLNVTSSNTDMPIAPGSSDGEFSITINGEGSTEIEVSRRGVVTTRQTLSTTELVDLTASPSIISGTPNSDILITINGTSEQLSVQSSDVNIITSVSGNNITVRSQQEITGTITVSARGCNSLTIPVSIANLPAITGNLDYVSGTLYVGEVYRFTVDEDLEELNATTSDPRIHVVLDPEYPRRVSFTTNQLEGETEINGTVTITARGKSPLTIPLVYKELLVITAQEDQNGVPFDSTITLTLSGGVPGMSVTTNNLDIRAEIRNEQGVYKVICTATHQGDADIRLYGRGLKDFYYVVSFIDKDRISYSFLPDNPYYYVNETFHVNVTGTARPITVDIVENGVNEVSANPDPLNPYSLEVSSTDDSRSHLVIGGKGIYTIETKDIEFLDVGNFSVREETTYPNICVGDVVRLYVTPGRENYEIVSDTQEITVSPKVGFRNVYEITASSAASGNINLTGRGMNTYSHPIAFTDLETPNVTATTQETTTYDDVIVYEVTGTNKVFSVQTSSPVIRVSETTQGSTKVLRVSASSPVSGTVTISGHGLTTVTKNVTFTVKDTVSVATTPNESWFYVNETFDIVISGTTKPISIRGYLDEYRDQPITLTQKGDVYNWTVGSTQSGTIVLEITGKGVETKTFRMVVKNLTTGRATLSPIEQSYFVNETVNLRILGAPHVDTLQVTSSAGNLNIAAGSDNTSKVITATGAVNGTIEIRGRGLENIDLPIIFEELRQMTVTTNPSNGRGYVKKGIILNVEGPEGEPVVSTQVPEFTIEKLS